MEITATTERAAALRAEPEAEVLRVGPEVRKGPAVRSAEKPRKGRYRLQTYRVSEEPMRLRQ